MPNQLAVFVGGAVGTAARAGLDEVSKALPVRGLLLLWSTPTINAVGAFLLGVLATWVASRLARGSRNAASLKPLKFLVGTGFVGVFTTYRTYIVASMRHASFNGIVEAVSQSLSLLALGGACAWVGTRAGEWLCVPSSVRPISGGEGRA